MNLEDDSQQLFEFECVTGFYVEDDHVVVSTSSTISDEKRKEIRDHLGCKVKFNLKNGFSKK